MNDGAGLFAMLISYKISVLLVGLALAFMGYRLFIADKSASAGDFSGEAGKYKLNLKGGAPGVFFSLFGAVVICVSILEGVTYDDTKKIQPKVNIVIPNSPQDSD